MNTAPALPGLEMAESLDRLAPITASSELDTLTLAAIEPYDFAWSGESSFRPYAAPALPEGFHLGVVVGTSGSGKSTLLREFGALQPAPEWEQGRTVASHFDNADDAVERLTAVGLASVPTWCKPYEVLSNGERFRADLARRIRPDALIDEFSSVVDRHVAMAASRGFARLIRRRDIRGVIVATCHRDVIPWLEPDWMVDTDAGLFLPNAKECVQPASLVVEVRRCRRDAWDHFVGHHYLASSLHVFARCYIATWDSQLVGFSAAIPFPHGTIKGAWRETRTVILPEFQGLGLGVRLSDHVAALHAAEGYRYFSRTQHPRMGEHRETSPDWRATSSNRKKATPVARDARFAHWEFDANRIAYSHEYIGPAAKIRDPMMPTAEQRAKAYKPSKAHRRVDP